MTKATLKNVNAAIAKHGVIMYKGTGYFYFVGQTNEAPEIPSIYTNFLYDLTLQDWVAHVDQNAK